MSLAERIAAAGIARPINWDELGSSAKDAWEERMIRSIERTERRRAALAERADRVLACGCYVDSPIGHTCASGGATNTPT